MRQEIVCPSCVVELRKLFPTVKPFAGENLRFTPGRAKHDFICDNCGAEIPQKSDCTAFSIWTDHDGSFDLYDWERNFLTTDEKENTKHE